MLVILEGPDLCYKTTIAIALEKFLHSSKLITSGGPPRELSEEQIDLWSKCRLDMFYQLYQSLYMLNKYGIDRVRLIMDRFIWSHAVYSELVGREFDLQYIKNYDDKISKLSINKLCVLTASPKTITERYKQRGDYKFDDKQIIKAVDLYKKYISQSKLPVKYFDTTNKSSIEVLLEVIEWVEK